jgi:hypothetical protein
VQELRIEFGNGHAFVIEDPANPRKPSSVG